jgi:hypothetical protein
VLDVLVAEVVLQGPGIVPVVGKFIAARMPQHVRMQWERHPGGLAEPLDEMVEADGAHEFSAVITDPERVSTREEFVIAADLCVEVCADLTG